MWDVAAETPKVSTLVDTNSSLNDNVTNHCQQLQDDPILISLKNCTFRWSGSASNGLLRRNVNANDKSRTCLNTHHLPPNGTLNHPNFSSRFNLNNNNNNNQQLMKVPRLSVSTVTKLNHFGDPGSSDGGGEVFNRIFSPSEATEADTPMYAVGEDHLHTRWRAESPSDSFYPNSGILYIKFRLTQALLVSTNKYYNACRSLPIMSEFIFSIT